MTVVKAREYNGTFSIIVKGHAVGDELVCAGISAIVYTLYGYLQNEDSIRTTHIKMQSGGAAFRFKGGEKAEAVYDMTVIGLMQMAETYPEIVSVDF